MENSRIQEPYCVLRLSIFPAIDSRKAKKGGFSVNGLSRWFVVN